MKSLTTDQLLQAILDELRCSKQKLGFGHPPKARYIYANRKYPDALWYFWDGNKNEHEPIQFHALTGMIERLEIEQKEFRGKAEQKVNLHVRAEQKYVIQAGFETLFAKGLLYALCQLSSAAFTQPVTIAVEAGDTEQVLFCRLYNPATGQSVYAPYPENTNWEQVVTEAIAMIEQAQGRAARADVIQPNGASSIKTPQLPVNPNREMLKRIGQITEHNNKQIATIIQANFPGYKSDRLNDLEIRSVVDAMCIDVAVQKGMDESKMIVAFGEWQVKLNPEVGNEKLAQEWMNHLHTVLLSETVCR